MSSILKESCPQILEKYRKLVFLRDVKSGVESQMTFGARESGVEKFCFKMPDSLEMSNFCVKKSSKM